LSSTWARRLQFEFPQCKTDLAATTGEGVKSNYTLPKDVFKSFRQIYQSIMKRRAPFVKAMQQGKPFKK
jgi:hypothetical protein